MSFKRMPAPPPPSPLPKKEGKKGPATSKANFAWSCARMGHMLRIREELADVVKMSNGEAIRENYRALAEHMDALIEAEAKCLAESSRA